MINIAGLPKAAVVAALINASKPLGYGAFLYKKVTVEEIQRQFDERTKELEKMALDNDRPKDTYLKMLYDFDYVEGVPIKADLSGDEFEERLYDRDQYTGAAARAIDAIRGQYGQ
jgi:hypothetical protein